MKKRGILFAGLLLASCILAACGKGGEKLSDTEATLSQSEKTTSDKDGQAADETVGDNSGDIAEYLMSGKYELDSDGDTKAYIKFYQDYTYTRFDGTEKSKLIPGTYSIEGEILCLKDDYVELHDEETSTWFVVNNTNRFKIEERKISFIPEGSDNLTFITLTDESVYVYSEPVNRGSAAVKNMLEMISFDLPDGFIVTDIEEWIAMGLTGSAIQSQEIEHYEEVYEYDENDNISSNSQVINFSEVGGISFANDGLYNLTLLRENGKICDFIGPIEQYPFVAYEDEHVENDEFGIILREYSLAEDYESSEYSESDREMFSECYRQFYFGYLFANQPDAPDIYILYIRKDACNREEFIEILKSAKDV